MDKPQISPEIFQVSPRDNLILLAGRVWDGISTQLLGPTAIYIQTGRIARLEQWPRQVIPGNTNHQQVLPDSTNHQQLITDNSNHQHFHANSSARVLDFSHLTLLPGLIDCHIHLALDGIDFQQAAAQWECPEALEARLSAELQHYLARGVLVVRDGGDRPGIAFRTAQAVQEGKLSGPRILASGQAIVRKGKYGSFLGGGVTSPEEAGKVIEQLAAQGVSQIKIVTSGIVSFSEYGKVGPLQFNPAELRSMVDFAHRLGLRVMAHASSEEAVATCLEAGVDSIEHGYFLSSESLRAMAYYGVAWVPTVVPVANQVLKPGCRAGYTPRQVEVISRTYREHQQKLHQAHHLGVPLAIGTDAGAGGVLHGYAHMEEMQLFADTGLANVAILQAATSRAAKVLGLEKEYGTIAPGKAPCLLGVSVNPLEDLNFVNAIQMIVLPQSSNQA